MVLFGNAVVTIERQAMAVGGGTTFQPLSAGTNIAVSISPYREDYRMLPGARSVGYDYEVVLDATVDIREGDRLTGYNPRSLNPAPELVVRRVEEYLGVMPHWLAYVEDVSDGSVR